MDRTHVDVVIPTVGRPSLAPLLGTLRSEVLAADLLAPEAAVVVVDDRARPDAALPVPRDPRFRVVAGGGRGPAAARNIGWRATSAPWVLFLDDDVELPLGWAGALALDLARAGPGVAAVQGRLHVPLPSHRPPSDWERNVHGLEGARWITADMAVRRAALDEVDGFDEAFPRAYREDTDLALRLLDRGWALELGGRTTRHPVRPAPWWISVRLQRGNADDVRLERRHGPDWRTQLGVSPGTIGAHRRTVAAGLASALAGLTGRRRLAAALAAWWCWRTSRLTWSRIAPGPRTAREMAAMVATSVAIPPAACYHRLRGHLGART
ncbi:MAG TPA: glycosyltransferase [Acidimicrobiales bacterium]|nr:glycosyltransferase [Acidimicrobiales bacterium]